ncbi:MAG: helix-turn-helix domain-containing protein [Clostridia bacterium]|nr:helix-turn-helix domain-containing protein [Clostridia bacterium]
MSEKINYETRIRKFETLDKICDVLDCQPGDILGKE